MATQKQGTPNPEERKEPFKPALKPEVGDKMVAVRTESGIVLETLTGIWTNQDIQGLLRLILQKDHENRRDTRRYIKESN